MKKKIEFSIRAQKVTYKHIFLKRGKLKRKNSFSFFSSILRSHIVSTVSDFFSFSMFSIQLNDDG